MQFGSLGGWEGCQEGQWDLSQSLSGAAGLLQDPPSMPAAFFSCCRTATSLGMQQGMAATWLSVFQAFKSSEHLLNASF